MGAVDSVWRCYGNAAFKCDDGVLGDSLDGASRSIPSSDSESTGTFIGIVYPHMLLSGRYRDYSYGMYPADGQLLYFLSDNFSYELVLWIYTVTAQFSLWPAGNSMYAGLFMSPVFNLYFVDSGSFAGSLVQNGQGVSGQFKAFSGDFCHNFSRMRCGELYKSLDFKNIFKKFFLKGNKIWGKKNQANSILYFVTKLRIYVIFL